MRMLRMDDGKVSAAGGDDEFMRVTDGPGDTARVQVDVRLIGCRTMGQARVRRLLSTGSPNK